jgi:hypothetical protein
MKRQNLSLIFFALITLVIASCKDGEVGPAGANGKDVDLNKLWTFKEGFIKGTGTGTRLDGTVYSYNMDFEGHYSASASSYSNTSSGTSITVDKMYAEEGDAFTESSEISITFTVSSLVSLGSPVVNSYYITLTKDLGGNKFHKVGIFSFDANTHPVTVSNLSYNSGTGILTGNYTISLPASAGAYGSFSITNGTFSTKLSQAVLRVGGL